MSSFLGSAALDRLDELTEALQQYLEVLQAGVNPPSNQRKIDMINDVIVDIRIIIRPQFENGLQNTESSVKRLGYLVVLAGKAGFFDWSPA